MEPSQPQTIFYDTAIVAYLKLKGHIVIPQHKPNDKDKIEFRIDGDPQKIQSDLQDYFNNVSVGVQDYVTCIKLTKSLMYAMKDIKGAL